ncbi:hypothetical protein E2C01_034973 [Portunus trituberculatus]|uniref:Uncharacterized protein n=1 Tax=Portunus trituberculatus TaxID=210409 RepID=A0A5B7F8G9_PORTR|nr:hypothetical protein [Portunus trituberculatus]
MGSFVRQITPTPCCTVVRETHSTVRNNTAQHNTAFPAPSLNSSLMLDCKRHPILRVLTLNLTVAAHTFTTAVQHPQQ